MGGLFANLVNVSNNLRAFDRAMSTVQNNVANVSTPNFVRQTQSLTAKKFDVDVGIMGGVDSGIVSSSRNRFAEQAVWRQAHLFGRTTQRKGDLQAIEPVFSVSETGGIPAALNGFFNSVSQLTVSPNDATSRQLALQSASNVALSFNRAANALSEASGNTDRQLTSVVDQINRLGDRIAVLNAQRRSSFGAGRDPGADAEMHGILEELAEVVDYTNIETEEGTMTILIGGQTLFVIGDRKYDVSLETDVSGARILNQAGQDATSQFLGGRLNALLDYRNRLLPSYFSQLNTLASSFADRINTGLSAGIDQSGNAPTQDLFAYDATRGAAASITTNNLAPTELALASPSAPGGNDNAIALAALQNQPTMGSLSFSGYYSQMAAGVGRDLQATVQGESTYQALLAQAKSFRHEISSVSLDEEAAKMLQFQKAYQALAQMFKTINEMTETLINVTR